MRRRNLICLCGDGGPLGRIDEPACPVHHPVNRRKPQQRWSVLLRVEQQCDEAMTEGQMKKWVKEHFRGADYGKVTIVDCDPIRQVNNP